MKSIPPSGKAATCAVVASLLLLTFLSASVKANDPAPTWLSYVANEGGGKLVTYVEAYWRIPETPLVDRGSNGVSFWFGIENAAGANLVQPCLVWQYLGGNIYYIFNGYYQWHQFPHWSYSKILTAEANSMVYANVSYRNDTNPPSYDMWIGINGTRKGVAWNVAVDFDVSKQGPYTDTYFVVEHQPNQCDAYPPNNNVTFTNIRIDMDYQQIQPQFTAHQNAPACDSQGHVISDEEVMITWNSQGTP